MSDSTGEDLKVASGAEPATGQARMHYSTDKGPRGEDIFANRVTAAAHPVETRVADTQFATFIEERQAEAGTAAAREAIGQETLGAPRISDTMKANASAVEAMMKDPAKAAQIQREIAAARGMSAPATGPILDMTPPTTWGRMKDTIATFFGFGKKQEPIREI